MLIFQDIRFRLKILKFKQLGWDARVSGSNIETGFCPNIYLLLFVLKRGYFEQINDALIYNKPESLSFELFNGDIVSVSKKDMISKKGLISTLTLKLS